MKGLRTSLLLCALVAAGVTPTADAATATTILPVTATVLATCIVVATPLIFGNYSAAQVDAQAALTVTCTLGTPFVVRLDAGAGATIAARQLSFGANTLAYSLYRDAARTQNWGQTDGTDTASGTGALLPVILNVYGRIPAGQFSAPGAYIDTVGVTVVY